MIVGSLCNVRQRCRACLVISSNNKSRSRERGAKYLNRKLRSSLNGFQRIIPSQRMEKLILLIVMYLRIYTPRLQLLGTIDDVLDSLPKARALHQLWQRPLAPGTVGLHQRRHVFIGTIGG